MIFKTCLALALAAAIAAAHPSSAPAPVRVWESTLSLPTYQEGPPNPNPPFDLFETGRFNYPYTIRDTLTNDRRTETWRTLHLENEYLRVTVLPDLGGHLYSCVDKISGREMFYANPSIKKALIGYRGAWAALGIEFNFPVSHNWMSMSPVDFATSTRDDGSASIWVGNTDRVYGTAWRVQLTLQPGRAVLDQDVTLENPSDVRRRFYWWTNAAVEVGEDSRLIYPTRFMASHGFTRVDPWPVDLEGRDLSVIRNQTAGPVSMFTHGSREPFIGVYHPPSDTGVAHVAAPADLPTSKVWSWGVDADGLSWRDALSDNRSAYIELQAGLFRNQETYAFLEPQESIRFTEHWVPVRGIGPFTRATTDAVVRVGRTSAGALDVALNVTRERPAARLRILDGRQTVADEAVDLGPAATLTKSYAGLTAPGPYTVELRDASGAVLLRHVEGEYEGLSSDEVSVGPQSAYQSPPARDRSEADVAALGEQQELDGKLLGAARTYRDGLARFPESFVLNRAAGRIAVTLRRNQDAVALLGKALWRTSNDPETHYYLGLAYDGVGEGTRAREQWERAHRFGPLRRAACVQLARLLAREGDTGASLGHLQDLLRGAPDDARIGALHTAVLRMTGDTAAARRQAASSFLTDPTQSFLRVERAALGVDDPALWRHLGAEPERVLDVAGEYMRIGAFAQALDVLDREYPAVPDLEREPGAVAPQDHVLVAYYRGYGRERLGRSGAADYLRASGLSTDYVFPNRPLTATVLRAALTSNASDSTGEISPRRAVSVGRYGAGSRRGVGAGATRRRAIPYAPPQPGIRMVLRAAPARPRRGGSLGRCCCRSREQGRVRGVGSGDEPARSPRLVAGGHAATLSGPGGRSSGHCADAGARIGRSRAFLRSRRPVCEPVLPSRGRVHRSAAGRARGEAAARTSAGRAQRLRARDGSTAADARRATAGGVHGRRRPLAARGTPLRDRDSTNRTALRRARCRPDPTGARAATGPRRHPD